VPVRCQVGASPKILKRIKFSKKIKQNFIKMNRKSIKAISFPAKKASQRAKIEIIRQPQPSLSNVQRSEIKKLISAQQEHKFFEIRNAFGVTYAGTVTSLSDVPQGDTDSTRDADTLMPTSLVMRFGMTVGDTTNFFRVIIFRWHSALSVPTVVQVLQNASSSTGGVYSDFNHDLRSNFQVLFDKTFTLGTTAVTSNQVVFFNKTLKMARKPIQYTSGSTSGSDKIYFLAISDSAAIPNPTWNYAFRLNFTDS
jgi:hypothetical protein